MTKKVLIIERHPDFEIGGVEKYNNLLGKILNENYKNVQVDKACMYQPKDHKTFPNNSYKNKYYYLKTIWKCNDTQSISDLIGFTLNSFKFKKMVYKLEKKNKYDLIIDGSAIITFSKFLKMNQYLWVQHDSFEKLLIKKFSFKNIIKRLLGFKNNFLFAKNLVLYNENNLDYLKTLRKNDFIYYCINLCSKILQISKDELNAQSKCRKKIIYFGRIDEEQKNLSLLLEINKKINLIDFYGEGNLEIIKQLGNSYKGYINPLISPLELINKYKFMILMSKHEGFSFSLVQALACGVPIIVRDTFINASYLTNNNQNGFLLNNNLTVEEYATKIKDIYSINENEYLQLCKNAYNFACRNLSESEFINKWMDIFNKYLK